MLKERDRTVSEISEAFAISTPSISYHLDLLKQAELVSAQKKGQFVTYSLETTVLTDSLGWILDLIKKKKRKRKQNEKETRVARSSSRYRTFRRSNWVVE